MLQFKNITIIGSSHIAKSSVEEIERAFHSLKPEIVAVELDRSRLEALLSDAKPSYSIRLVREIGIKGYLFAIIGSFLQKKLGSVVGMRPGSDMLCAATVARDNKAKIALIDRDIRITLSRLSKNIRFKEKMNFVIDLLKSPFSKKIKINLNDVPEKKLIAQMMALLKKRYPGVFKVLVTERNQFMAERIVAIAANHPEEKMLVVIGAGHENELLELIKSKMRD
jgi:pheromone shutdown-related protein TraB